MSFKINSLYLSDGYKPSHVFMLAPGTTKLYGTFKGLAKLLKERNCGKLYLAVSHITVQNHDKDNVFQYFDKVFTTNSKYDVYYERIDGNSGKEIKNLEIIKMF
jgi:phosphoribosylpyrophosphate synthetase